MLELKDRRYFIATEDGGVIGAYYDLDDAKIDAQDAWESHKIDIQILEADFNHEVTDGIFLKIFRKLDWKPTEEEEKAEEKIVEEENKEEKNDEPVKDEPSEDKKSGE